MVDSINNSGSSIQYNIPGDLPPEVQEQIKQVEKTLEEEFTKAFETQAGNQLEQTLGSLRNKGENKINKIFQSNHLWGKETETYNDFEKFVNGFESTGYQIPRVFYSAQDAYDALEKRMKDSDVGFKPNNQDILKWYNINSNDVSMFKTVCKNLGVTGSPLLSSLQADYDCRQSTLAGMYDNNLEKEYKYRKGDRWRTLLSNISKIKSSLDKLGEAGGYKANSDYQKKFLKNYIEQFSKKIKHHGDIQNSDEKKVQSILDSL